MKPSYKKPYYYLHNVNINTEVPTNPYAHSAVVTGNADMDPETTGVQSATNALGEGTDSPTAEYSVSPTASSVTNAIASSTGAVVGEGGSNDTFNLPRTVNMPNNMKASLVEKPTAQRLANASKVRVEIRTGKDDSIFELKSIYIDYIKAPQYIRLTQEQIDLTEDTSQMMEFPDYVCQEIINELTHLIMENSSDPRLQSHMPVTMSIANPAQG